MAMRDVVMPRMGESIQDATITRWLVEVGSIVVRDQTLFEVSTDKVDAEIPCPCTGVVAKILYPTGSTVPVDEVVALINDSIEPALEQPAEVTIATKAHGATPSGAESSSLVDSTALYPRVFLVHGHDEIAQQKTARFLERLG